MKKTVIFIILLLFVLTCASAQSIENQLIASIKKSKKVVLHNKYRVDLCDGVTKTTIDRDGKAWMYDLYSSSKSNHFERVIIVKADEWTIVRERFEQQSNGTLFSDEPAKLLTTKKFKIDRLTDVLMKFVKPDKPQVSEKVLAVR